MSTSTKRQKPGKPGRIVVAGDHQPEFFAAIRRFGARVHKGGINRGGDHGRWPFKEAYHGSNASPNYGPPRIGVPGEWTQPALGTRVPTGFYSPPRGALKHAR